MATANATGTAHSSPVFSLLSVSSSSSSSSLRCFFPRKQSSITHTFRSKTTQFSVSISRANPNRAAPLLAFFTTHNYQSQSSSISSDTQKTPISKVPFLDSLFVICTSLALSFALFVADVDQASAFVVTTQRKLQPDELATVRLFQENTPSVVYITNLATKQDAFTLDVFEVPQGSGSGFVWDKNGHIVTNYHVIRGASDLRVVVRSCFH